ncbi:MAG TPA: D-2-hydroxyacid dehydrogenase [Spirochaetia bacterium]|nr:D-2-hydroxyacid dehydrogenase [Spirochaetia bacterium]
MKVLLIAIEPERIPSERLAEIRSIAMGYETLVSKNEEEIRSRHEDIEVVAGSIPHRLLIELPNLRWYQQYGAGADWLMKHPETAERDFLLTNSSGVHAVPITEHIMAYLLCFARGFKASILGQGQRVWEENRRQPLFELYGKRALLIGVGAIGARFAGVASVFGMEVVGVRRTTGRRVEGILRTVGPDSIDAELPEADFLVLTMPHTPETHHMIDERRIALMKSSSYLVNIGRGGTVDEEALVKALSERRIAGAGLDVFETEPLPEGSKLWELENVIITPHYSGITPRYTERFMEIFIDNLKRFVRGEALRNLVDMNRGY